jgi:putative ATP-dependent endonuclease of the OLD family
MNTARSKSGRIQEGLELFISKIKIENFRLFGSGDHAFVLDLNPGLTALVGENDAGKTAVVDALRLLLGTRDQEYLRLEPTDFHRPSDLGNRTEQILIRCTFEGLTAQDRGAFAEYLTYRRSSAAVETVLHVTWTAKRNEKEGTSRRYLPIEWRSGSDGDGPLLDPSARFLLTATYLRPLRDAERAMSAGRGSRLSQILQHTDEIKNTGKPFKKTEDPNPDPTTLSVLGLGDYANYLLGESQGIKNTRKKLNTAYLSPLSFSGDPLDARISISGSSDDATRLRQLLEKLEVSLGAAGLTDQTLGRGLGSNNLLFMACELLLLTTEVEGFPLLLIEEPEAHLHPQRQLRLMGFLQDQATKPRADGQQIQIIVTTHSPNLASDIKLDNLVLIRDAKAFPMARERTKLVPADYRFLERFLDVTKANLFFARGVVIVEGDAENILLPALARLIGRDLREYGVSIVNVGGVGLRRYANIFLRAEPGKDGEVSVPVACVADMDVMPDCGPWILGKLKEGEAIPKLGESKRKWRVKQDFPGNDLASRRDAIKAKASGQRVKTFVADEWTLEYDLAFCGLGEYVWIAAHVAANDERIHAGTTSVETEAVSARNSFAELTAKGFPKEELASHIYAQIASDGVSKTITAQYLTEILEESFRKKELTIQTLRSKLPSYLVHAIAYVTRPFEEGGTSGSVGERVADNGGEVSSA